MVGRAARVGAALGYYPNAKKCWLVVKSEKLKEANSVCGDRNKHHHGRAQTPRRGIRTEVLSREVCGQQNKGVDQRSNLTSKVCTL